MPDRAKAAREIAYTWVGIAFSIAFLVVGVIHPVSRLIHGATGAQAALADVIVILVVAFYVWGQLIYESCRIGYLKCFAHHQALDRKVLEAIYDRDYVAPLIVLVPAYCEPPAVVRMTLMSAALLEHPNHTVALLIDDPPDQTEPAAVAELDATRRTVDEIENTLRTQEQKYNAQVCGFCQRVKSGVFVGRAEGRRIEMLYLEVAQWLEEQARGFSDTHYVEALFVEQILREPARKHRARAAEIAARSLVQDGFSKAEAHHEYRRLAALFAARVMRFERKRYVNLSLVKNKASNLNSFIGMLGGSFRDQPQPDGLHLQECAPALATLHVPDAEYAIICDADSLLLGDYALKLLPVMEQSGGERIAVAQVHSRAVPHSPCMLQRAAGLQVDNTRVTGLGAVRHGAAFWIGNNALLRRAALQDIEEMDSERGFPIRRYLRDRTLIEDTETTLEFLAHGWTIYSLPEMLAYVGVPADYGALLVQRRRWAGGGLLNVPRLFGYLRATPDRLKRGPETLLRLHYLGFAAATLGWFLVPFLGISPTSPPPTWWLLMSLPFSFLYWHDLGTVGCSLSDIARVQALNMLLIPVSMEGFVNVARWRWIRHRRTFPRTPKSKFRTPAPASYSAIAILIPLFAAFATVRDASYGKWLFAAFGLLNTALLVYALVKYVGLAEALTDIRSTIRAGMKRRHAAPVANATEGFVEAPRAYPDRLTK